MATISLQSCGRCGDPTISRRIGRALCELLDEIEMWIQKQFSLPAKPRGFHLITREVLEQISRDQAVAGWDAASFHTAYLGKFDS